MLESKNSSWQIFRSNCLWLTFDLFLNINIYSGANTMAE